ncbi:MAG: hypothetical protein ACOC9B_04965 [Chloroflexota bacterium]
MARKIVYLCDYHLVTEKVEVEVQTPNELPVAIGGTEYTVMLCTDCAKEWYQPLVDLENLMGKPVQGQMYPCAFCDKKYEKRVSRDSHQVKAHKAERLAGRNEAPLIETRCKYCPFEFTSNQSRGQHMRQSHPEEWERERQQEKT